MTETEDEKYLFLRLFSIDMNTAAHTIRILRRYKRDDVRVALLRDLAVTYARPFSINKGHKIPTHSLSPKHVPKNYKQLHDKLLELRNSQFAHTDLKFHNPRISRWRTKAGNIYPMSFKSFDYPGLLRQLPKIEALIRAIENSVNSEVKARESRF